MQRSYLQSTRRFVARGNPNISSEECRSQPHPASAVKGERTLEPNGRLAVQDFILSPDKTDQQPHCGSEIVGGFLCLSSLPCCCVLVRRVAIESVN